MIRLSVLYPSAEGCTFDHDYYKDSHIPLAVATWSPASTEIDRGLVGPYVAAVHFTFASHESLETAMANPASAAVRADVPNYTNITPISQISEITC
jgi:uncharacterized protein (TIGR02118 family)